MSFTFHVTWYEPAPAPVHFDGRPRPLDDTPPRWICRTMPSHHDTLPAAIAAQEHIRAHLDDWIPAGAYRPIGPDAHADPLRPEVGRISYPPNYRPGEVA